jgi:hypothetical protein
MLTRGHSVKELQELVDQVYTDEIKSKTLAKNR